MQYLTISEIAYRTRNSCHWLVVKDSNAIQTKIYNKKLPRSTGFPYKGDR